MGILKTATGKQYPCNFMGVATGYAALYIKIEIDLTEAITVFQNPEETNVLTWINEDTNEVVRIETGYTVFTDLSIMKGDCPVRIRLSKEDIV